MPGRRLVVPVKTQGQKALERTTQPRNEEDPFGIQARAAEAEARGTTLFQEAGTRHDPIESALGLVNTTPGAVAFPFSQSVRDVTREAQAEGKSIPEALAIGWNEGLQDTPSVRFPVTPKLNILGHEVQPHLQLGLKGLGEAVLQPDIIFPGAFASRRIVTKVGKEAAEAVAERIPQGVRQTLAGEGGFARLGGKAGEEAAGGQTTAGANVTPVQAAPPAPPAKIVGTAAGSADEPPIIPPSRPRSRRIPPPEGEPVTPASIERALEIGRAVAARDKPGIVKRTIDLTPGFKQLQRGLQPAIDMPENILASYIAEGNVQSAVAQELASVRIPAVRLLDDAFGADVVRGTRKSTVPFVGTADEARYPATSTMLDIAQNPHLYDLLPSQRAAITRASDALSQAYDKVVSDYGLDIGKFEVKPGSMFLSNIEKRNVGTSFFQDIIRTTKSGRAKTRFYETARDRWMHTPDFKPIIDVEHLIGSEMHGAVASMSGRSVYRTGIEGLDRIAALRATGHDKLVDSMLTLRKKLQSLRGAKARLEQHQADAIDDFLSSPVEDLDLAALREGLEPTISRGKNVGKDVMALNRQIRTVRADIAKLRPSWKVAETRGYQFVQDGIFRYFPDDVASHVRRLNQVSGNRLLSFVDDLRATAFGGDLSPVSNQGFTLWLADPIGASQDVAQQVTTGIRNGRGVFGGFTEDQILQDIAENADSWARFTEATGINALGSVDREFSVGLIGKVPGIGKQWTQFNEAVYRPLLKSAKRIFDDSYNAAVEGGLDDLTAMAIAGDDATKIIPRVSYRRLGMSQAQYARWRALMTSVSFLTQPAAVIADASKGMVKLGLLHPQMITRNEQFAMKRMATLAATTALISATSSAYYAAKHGQNVEKAVRDSLNPTHPNFMSLKTPWGARIGLGGPYRSLIRAMAPRKIDGVPFPMPFANMGRFALSKLGPAPRILYDEIRNVDYYGQRIRTGDFPINILQGIGYAATGVAPLTIGSGVRSAIRGEGVGRTTEELISQFAGTNYITFDPIYDAKKRWEESLQKYHDIPSNTANIPEGKVTRTQYRDAFPLVDAKLFLSGEVSSIRDGNTVPLVITLMRDNDIDPRAVPGIVARRKKVQEFIASGRLFQRTPVDDLISAIDAQQPRSTPAPQPAQSQPSLPQPTPTNQGRIVVPAGAR